MARVSNVFYNLVTDENSTTELLCNLMRFTPFRGQFLTLFLSEEAGSEVDWDDFDTQVVLPGSGRPDIQIETDRLLCLIEVKVTPELPPSAKQLNEYVKYLLRRKVDERWLIFLVPRTYCHVARLNECFQSIAALSGSARVHTRIVYWEDVISMIEADGLATLNPVLNDFNELLVARFKPRPVVFSPAEVLMLFTNQVPLALTHLQGLIDGIQGRGTMYKVHQSGSRSLRPDYGLYFYNPQGQEVLWFGVWTPFWEKYGNPLCFGVREKWSESIRQAFTGSYKGPTRSFGGYIVGWVDQEALSGENPIDKTWALISPTLDALMAATQKEG